MRRVLPPRVNEVVGVSHIKAYLFDNDILMSGANLSSDYFTIRQVTLCILAYSCMLACMWLLSASRRAHH